MPDASQTTLPSARDLQALIEAERAGMPFLHWRDGEGTQRIYLLQPGLTRVTVGRREQSDIAITWDTEVSRAHALLEPVGDEWTLVDDGLSRNGSYVNGSRVRGRHRLHHRDTMTFGSTRIVFHGALDGHPSQSTARPPDALAPIPLTETQRRVLIALCRPVFEGLSTTPASNPRIAHDVFLSVDAVKAHLRILFERFGCAELPQNEKRGRLVSTVLDSGALAPHEF